MELSTGLSILAFIMSFWTFYRNWLAGANIEVSVGDSIDLIQHSNGPALPQSIHIACTFSNTGSQIGVIEKLVLVVHPHGKPKQLVDWAVFYEYEDGVKAAPAERVHSISVLPKSIHFQGIQFSADEHSELQWGAGPCKIELIGWVNRDCKKAPNLRRELHLNIADFQLNEMLPSEDLLARPSIHKVPLEGYKVWELSDILE
jgi:hypothetical protein